MKLERTGKGKDKTKAMKLGGEREEADKMHVWK